MKTFRQLAEQLFNPNSDLKELATFALNCAESCMKCHNDETYEAAKNCMIAVKNFIATGETEPCCIAAQEADLDIEELTASLALHSARLAASVVCYYNPNDPESNEHIARYAGEYAANALDQQAGSSQTRDRWMKQFGL